MAALSEWLQIMLGEIARKREELDRGQEEEVRRQGEQVPAAVEPAPVVPATRR